MRSILLSENGSIELRCGFGVRFYPWSFAWPVCSVLAKAAGQPEASFAASFNFPRRENHLALDLAFAFQNGQRIGIVQHACCPLAHLIP